MSQPPDLIDTLDASDIALEEVVESDHDWTGNDNIDIGAALTGSTVTAGAGDDTLDLTTAGKTGTKTSTVYLETGNDGINFTGNVADLLFLQDRAVTTSSTSTALLVQRQSPWAPVRHR